MLVRNHLHASSRGKSSHRLPQTTLRTPFLRLCKILAALAFFLSLGALPALAVPAAPVITPGYGIFGTTFPQGVSISAVAGATIKYTLDGSTPDQNSPTYSGTLQLSSTVTVKAIAIVASESSPVTSAFLQFDSNTNNIVRTGCALWLKSDNSLSASGSSVTSWRDMMSGNYATQSNASNQPTFVANAVNSLPAVSFNGSTSYLSLPSNYTNLFTTCMFVVSKPTAANPDARLVELGNGSVTNSAYLSQPISTALALNVYNNNDHTSLTSSNAVTLNQYQILEACVDDQGRARIFTNATQNASGTMSRANVGTRATNFLGTDFSLSKFFTGEIAEVLIYSGSPLVTETARKAVEGYLLNRYALVGPPPSVTPLSAVYPTPGGGLFETKKLLDPVTISSIDYNATLKYTIDGSTPGPGSNTYTAPFFLTDSAVVKAIASRPYGNSAVSTPSYFQFEQSASSVTRDSLILWLKADYGVTSSSGKVSEWIDMSGVRTDATQQSSSSQPTIELDSQNGHPVLKFSGAQFMNLAPGFSSFPGLSVFIVTSPSNSGPGRLIELGNGAAGNNIKFSSTGTTPTLSIGVGSLSSSSALTLNQYQALEGFQNGGTGTIKVNGVTSNSGSLPGSTTTTRSQNTIGAAFDGASEFFQGGIAEILIYKKQLNATELANLHAYLLGRYQLLSVAPPAPIISMPSGSYSEPFEIQISAPGDCSIFFTSNGDPPTINSELYQGPIRIIHSDTIKAIAVKAGVASGISEAVYNLNATQWPKPKGTDTAPLDFQIRLPSMAVPQ